ncbi:sugar kinase [Heyndrickxia sp. FSL W8-0496]|uniref:PfkB family carbohydrate kinase n=1 Tax=Heyndrickxia TaxID=2837504 RepID=UPI000716F502
MDVITIGESMVLFTPKEEGPLRYVSEFKKTMGGAESNVAIALARLGHSVGWVSKLGDDEFGLFIRNFIRGEGVDTSQVIFDDHLPTAVFFKEKRSQLDPNIYYYRKGSAFSSIQFEDLDTGYLSQAKFIHLTGITPALSHSSKETLLRVVEFAHSNEQTLVFDPNIRLKLWTSNEAKETLLEISKNCHIVMPGIEEGVLMTGETSPENIAKSLLNNKTKVVIVKLGEKGAYFATQEENAYVPAYRVDHIVDTAGAGDGFAAGVLSGLIRGWDYYQSVRFGNKIGSFALGVLGDMEGYPYWNQVSSENKKSQILR